MPVEYKVLGDAFDAEHEIFVTAIEVHSFEETPAYFALLHSTVSIPPHGEYIYAANEQAVYPMHGNGSEQFIASHYGYIQAMFKGSFMRDRVPEAGGRALLLGLGSGLLTKLIIEGWPQFEVETVEYSQSTLDCVNRHFIEEGSLGKLTKGDALEFFDLPHDEAQSYDLIGLDCFGRKEDGTFDIDPRFYSHHYLMEIRAALEDNGVFIANFGDYGFGEQYHHELRSAIQYLGELFSHVYLHKSGDSIKNAGNLVVVCVNGAKGPASDWEKRDFFPYEFSVQMHQEIPDAKTSIDKRIKFQRFTPFGRIASVYPTPISDWYSELKRVTFSSNTWTMENMAAWDQYQDPNGHQNHYTSLTYDKQHMLGLINEGFKSGEYTTMNLDTIWDGDQMVAILPWHVSKWTALDEGKDKNTIYSTSMVGEDIIINYEPIINPNYLIPVMNLMPPYMSQDISFYWSDRAYMAARLQTTVSPQISSDPSHEYPTLPPDPDRAEASLRYSGVCLFEYETTRVRSLADLYPYMDRDDRKEAQRLIRNVERDLRIEVGTKIPQGEAWKTLYLEYMDLRKEIDDADPQNGTEGFHSSVEGTLDHLKACLRAEELGMLRTVEIWDQDKLVALNLSIHHRNSLTIADVVCFRSNDHKYKRYGLGIVAILINMEYASNLVLCDWYDLGNIGIENNYKYKRMFFTDVVFRMGLCAAGPPMLAEAAILGDDCGFIYPLVYNREDSCAVVNSAEEANTYLVESEPSEIQGALSYYESLDSTPGRVKIISHLQALLEAKAINGH